MDELVRIFCDLVRIHSESGNEEVFLRYLAPLFRERLDADCALGGDGNLIARVPSRGCDSDEPIMLAAHADTVKPGVGIEPVIESGVIRSDGSTILGADNKAAIAEILVAVETAEVRPPLEIVITHGEEIGLLGAKALDRSTVRARSGFVFDTSDLRFEEVAVNAGVRAEARIRVDYEAAALPETSDVVQLAKAVLEDAGLEPDVKMLLGGTDAIVFQKKGIDTVVMGYGGQDAHSTREHIAIADMVTACEIIQGILRRSAEVDRPAS